MARESYFHAKFIMFCSGSNATCLANIKQSFYMKEVGTVMEELRKACVLDSKLSKASYAPTKNSTKKKLTRKLKNSGY